MRIHELSNLSEVLTNITDYHNWIRYTPQSLQLDFTEYKKKESTKWASRAAQIGARFPLFDSAQDFQSALEQAEIVLIDELPYEVQNMTKNTSLDSIKHMVGTYQKPRDVDRIVQGYQNNQMLPLPIILKGHKGAWIMAGNTRQSTARVLGIQPQALLVDVTT